MRATIQLDPLRGFRDVLPPESTRLLALMRLFSDVVESRGYQPVIPPTLERFELFALKSGEEIRNSMFTFRDKSGREVALRPEVTASIARIYLRHLRARPKPLRLYYIANCFRYENPQRARYREFWQAGVELLGAYSVASDFEVIALLADYVARAGLAKQARVKIGSTRVYRALFRAYGISEEVQDHILHLMDKKMYERALEVVRSSARNADELVRTLTSLWDNPGNVSQAMEVLEGVPQARAAVEELLALDKLIREYGLPLSYYYDLAFARGLAYYTGVIFEVEVEGFGFSIAGGGRYDGLVELYGGESLPGTGFAVGLDRLLYVMNSLGVEPSYVKPRRRVAIVALSEDLVGYAAKVQRLLTERVGGVSAALFYGEKLSKLIPRLLDEGYEYLVVVGPREAAEGKVTVKDLRRKVQETLELDELPGHVEG